MRIFCSICKDIFIPYSEIQVTKCGHLYHSSCISRWLKQHQTCPQCRSNLKSQLIRVYFDVDKDSETDVGALEYKIETLTNELQQNQLDKKSLKEENEKYEKILQDLESCATTLKRKNDLLKSSVQALKDQIGRLSKQSEINNKLRSDFEALQTKISFYQGLELVINSTSEAAEEFIKHTPVTEFGVRQLSVLVGALKDQTEKDKEKLARLSEEVKELQKALLAEQKKKCKISEEEYRNLISSNNALKEELDSAKEIIKDYSEKLAAKNNENAVASQKRSKIIKEINGNSGKKRSIFNINFDAAEIEDTNKRSRFSDTAESVKQWEDLIVAGPSRQFGLSFNKSMLNKKTANDIKSDKAHKRDVSNYEYDGMGSRKKINLGHATPLEEFKKIRKTEGKKILEITRHKSMLDYLFNE